MVTAVNRDNALKEVIGIRPNEAVHTAFAMGTPGIQYCRPIYKEKKRIYML